MVTERFCRLKGLSMKPSEGVVNKRSFITGIKAIKRIRRNKLDD